MKRAHLLLFIPVFVLLAPKFAFGEKIPLNYEFDVKGIEYSPSTPKPEDVIGHQIGTRHTRPHQAVEYFRLIAERSDRVVYGEHGRTYEGRPLVHAIVTSPSNQARLGEIQAFNRRLSDEPGSVSDNDIENMPVVIWMGYSVHGNEASGTEAAILLLYHLAAGKSPEIDALLNQSIILIDPMLNPDGRSRFTSWVNSNRGHSSTTDPEDREHSEPWPGGRTNHYWFDLNRDWLPAQLEESKGRLQLFHTWRPQLHTDFHEMGSSSTFFFQPGVSERNNPNTPQRNYELTKEIAGFHAKALDQIGSLYYSEETFDDFYYGKGSSYPDINGGVGILFEQASSRSLKREIPNGVLEFGFTIRNQFATSLSSLEAAYKMREKLIRNQRDFYRESVDIAAKNPIKAYLISREGNGGRDLDLIELLLRHRIRVFALSKDIELNGGAWYRKESSFIIPTQQPQTRILTTIMEAVKDFEDSIFYDISAWTIPFAMGVSFDELAQEPSQYQGSQITELIPPKGKLLNSESSYAYSMKWGSYKSAQALFGLQNENLETRVLLKSATFSVPNEEIEVSPSTIIVPAIQKNRSKEEVYQVIARIAERHGVDFLSINTGLTSEGPDLGSPSVPLLTKPNIALITGSGTRSSEVGQTWFMLDYRIGIPVSLIDLDRLDRVSLDRYNTLIVCSGNYSQMSEETLNRIKAWIRSGGLLIATRDGAKWVIDQKLVPDTLKEFQSELQVVPYAEAADQRRSQSISGAIFKAELDTTHPIAFGLPETLPFFRNHDNYFQVSKSSGNTVAKYGENPLLSGYAPSSKIEAITNSAAVIARRVGRGSIVLFADDPNFRAFWLGTGSMFLNAVMFGHIF